MRSGLSPDSKFFYGELTVRNFAPHTAVRMYIVSYSHIVFNLFYSKSIAVGNVVAQQNRID